MWRKRNSRAPFVGIQTGAATLENSMDFLKKLKILLPYAPAIALLKSSWIQIVSMALTLHPFMALQCPGP